MLKKKLTEELINEYTKVAYLYHKTGLTQEDIAQKMSMSRQRVNRILAECISLGIVLIEVVNINDNYLELETELELKYNLKGVRIVNNVIEENIYEDLGRAAGLYIGQFIKDGDIIGFSRGRAVSATVDNLPLLKRNDLTVTQLLGSENGDRQHTEVDDIVRRAAEKMQAKTAMLYAPVIVQDSSLRNSIMKEPYFTETYKTLQACNTAVVGVGGPNSKAEYLSPLDDIEESRDLLYEQVAGEVGTHFFNYEGKIVDPGVRDHIIAISYDDFMNIPIRIGIAGLPMKLEAIFAALKGGYINVLVTDVKTAELLQQKN